MDQQERIKAMASIMVQARQANEDVGELLASALQGASLQLGSSERLVSGRSGSWESDIVLRMAEEGGHAREERVNELIPLFVMMAEAHEDGGDVLSQAMSGAVDELGGLDAFAGTSQWYHDLINIGCQYSQYKFDSASVFHQAKEERNELARQHQHEENERVLRYSHSDEYVPGEEG